MIKQHYKAETCLNITFVFKKPPYGETVNPNTLYLVASTSFFQILFRFFLFLIVETTNAMLPPRGKCILHPRKGGTEERKTEVPKISGMYYS